jgi:hypothetical protein
VISAEAKAFVNFLMTTDPTQRPSATQALSHAWLADVNVPIFPSKDQMSTDEHTQIPTSSLNLGAALYKVLEKIAAENQQQQSENVVQ